MNKTIIFILFSFLFQACAVVQIRPVTSSRLEEEHVLKKNYLLNSEKIAFVGESMLTHKDYFISKSFTNVLCPDKDFRYGESYFFEKGNGFIIKGEVDYKNATYYLIDFDNISYMPMYRMINKDGELFNRFVYFGKFGPEVSPTSVSFTTDPLDVKFVRKEVEKVDENSGFINFELLYTGIDNNSISILYREFTPDNLIRAAYSQDLKYPANSKMIRFRNIVIDVLDVNGEKIVFSVRNDN